MVNLLPDISKVILSPLSNANVKLASPPPPRLPGYPAQAARLGLFTKRAEPINYMYVLLMILLYNAQPKPRMLTRPGVSRPRPRPRPRMRK